MVESKQTPAIRFRGFNGDWEKRKLGEIASEILAGGDVDKNLLHANGHYPVIANALTNDGIVGYYNTEYRVTAPAVTITGRGDIGHAKARTINFTPIVRLISLKSNHDVFFLENAINTLNIILESTGVPQLTVPQLSNYELVFPRNLSEEKIIGSYFNNLDNLISLHQQKHTQLMAIKKAMLEKMFPKEGETVPEIRFAGFTEPWERHKFSNIAIRSSTISCEEELPRIEYEDIISGIGQLKKNVFEKKSRKSGLLFMKGDILYGKLRPYLQNWLLASFSGIAVGDFWVLRPQSVDSYFLYRLVQNRQFDVIANQSTGTKMPRADWKLVSNSEFFIPSSLIEQKKIGFYFHNLDTLITLQQKKINQLQHIKKAFLDKMFV